MNATTITARDLLRDAHAHLLTNYPSRELVARSGFAVALVDGRGRVVAATEHTQIANVERVVRTCARRFAHPSLGDVVITNDPYSGGTRVQDQFVLTPVQGEQDTLQGYVVACAPFCDVGGMTLGNDVPAAGDLWTEGVRTTPVHVCRGGKVDEDIIRLLQLNSRVPALIRLDHRSPGRGRRRASSATPASLLEPSSVDDRVAATRRAVLDGGRRAPPAAQAHAANTTDPCCNCGWR